MFVGKKIVGKNIFETTNRDLKAKGKKGRILRYTGCTSSKLITKKSPCFEMKLQKE